jgi:hypothetical protein
MVLRADGSGGGIGVGTSLITGGADTQVLFNDGGFVGSDAGLTYNKTMDIFSVVGAVRLGDGSESAPAFAFTSDTNLGFYRVGADTICLVTGFERFLWTLGDYRLGSVMGLGWSANGAPSGGAADLSLWRDAAGTLAQRNGANAQASLIYNTFTDASNYERLSIAWASNICTIQTQEAGTGTQRAMRLGASGAANWEISTSGHLLAVNDNTYDIGATGATRPKNLYLGGTLIGGVQSLSGAGAFNLTTLTTAWTTTAADAGTLADGVVGQLKYVIMVADGGDGTLTPTNLFNGTSITFDAVNDAVLLQFIGTEWHVICNFGATINA